MNSAKGQNANNIHLINRDERRNH